MRLGSLSAELDSITREFDYGIVPGSATVFVRDELNGIGRLDLTLLEGVMIVLEVTDQGYKVTSCSPLCNVDPALSTAQTVQAHLEAPFESMENLLMTISPMFRDRFQQALFDKLQSVQTQQQLDAAAAAAAAASHDSSLPHPSATLLHQQQIFAQNHAPPPVVAANRGSSSSSHNTNSDNNIQNLHHTSDEVSFDELNHWIN